ncbi:MAG: flagellar biosynthesis protein FliQ [Deltaproteobacteria bacterium]|nr:flagellar biosynthesis protein FliQ [Deltaproteobacteria bacterium]MCB9787824.1 flagellar biosynthesis protein FliQ [Deltaproteobacteria bacterium]
MNSLAAGDLLQRALQVTYQISAPMLFAGLIVGVVVSIFQAATQVNEVTLVFIPKMLAVGAVMWLAGPWMYDLIFGLFREIAAHIDQIGAGRF